MHQTLVELPYGAEQIHFRVPTQSLMGVYAPRDVPTSLDTRAIITNALANPIGAAPLRELAWGARRVLLVADDNTRPTPTHIILPVMLDELNCAGVRDEAIEVLIALGTHRKMTDAEIACKFGAEVVKRVQITNHEAFAPEALADLGLSPGGASVQVNRKAMEADLVLGVGSIVPHHIPGFSGGAKIIQPGICGEHTTGQVHLLSVRRERSLLGVLENPVRQEMEAIAERAGLRAILNTVLDRHGRTVGAVYGDPRDAFREGVTLSHTVYGVEIAGLADIVIAGSHPCDIEFWQAHKTLYAAERAVRPGGSIIVVTPCPEGVAATHGEMLSFAGGAKEQIEAAILSGAVRDLTAGALALAWANTRAFADVSLVSGGIRDEEAQALGFAPYASVEDALQAAQQRHGSEATISVLPFAPDTLPLLP